MTFRLFKILNCLFEDNRIEVALCTHDDNGFYPIKSYNIDSEIEEIDNDMKRYSNAELYVFDGDFYTPLDEYQRGNI